MFEGLSASVINLIVSKGKRVAGDAVDKAKIDSVKSNLIRKSKSIRMVKTLQSPDDSIDLIEFYCPGNVLINGGRKIINNLDDFDFESHFGLRVVVEGMAGQGKSMFLRNICSNELRRGRCIPIFVELGAISRDNSLLDEIKTQLDDLGIVLDDQQRNEFLRSGAVTLFLDAFDEVPSTEIDHTLRVLSQMAIRPDKLNIIVTARPDSRIQFANPFSVCKLDFLTFPEVVAIIEKLGKDRDSSFQKTMIEGLENADAEVRQILSNPLLVNIFEITFRYTKSIPENLLEYYDTLFAAMITNHAYRKPINPRRLKSANTIPKVKALFEEFCFLSKWLKRSVFNDQDLEKISTKTIAGKAGTATEQDLLYDIKQVASLVIKDGLDNRFVHRTVQEHASAQFIANRPEVFQRRFLSQFGYRDTSTIENWKQDLVFYRIINPYGYDAFFRLPRIMDYLGRGQEVKDIKDLSNAPSQELIMAVLGEIKISFHLRDRQPLPVYTVQSKPGLKYIEEWFMVEELKNWIVEHCFSDSDGIAKQKTVLEELSAPVVIKNALNGYNDWMEGVTFVSSPGSFDLSDIGIFWEASFPQSGNIKNSKDSSEPVDESLELASVSESDWLGECEIEGIDSFDDDLTNETTAEGSVILSDVVDTGRDIALCRIIEKSYSKLKLLAAHISDRIESQEKLGSYELRNELDSLDLGEWGDIS